MVKKVGGGRWSTSRTLSLVFILSCNIFLCGCSSGGAFGRNQSLLRSLQTLIPPTAHMVQHRCDEMLLPLEEVAKRALLDGLESSQIKYLACPGPSFVLNNLEGSVKRRARDGSKTSCVSLMGGGEGMGLLRKTAKALGDALFDESMGRPIGQVVVICGRNKSLSSILIALYMLQW
ncbi:hypothetical protein IFM89_024777 [Coptis chinensis]|uniref:Uncharacterized protein n=1 Tax=Coptis chinensis TaxID=261450 RepID=A0A835LNY5_9MAGN|nr:hypothetical protein IFM89_024777 [Coptis chinensis]